MSRTTRCARWRLRVKTPADKPYLVSFARSTTSASVSNVSTEATGPKISSRTMRMSSVQLSKIAGLMNAPLARAPSRLRRSPPHSRSAPSLRPISTYSSTLSRCAWWIIGPICTEGSKGSPILILRVRSTNCLMKASLTLEWTKMRVPLLHTWPLEYQLASMAADTASRTSASSNTMSGDLPPSSIWIFLRVGAASAQMADPVAISPVNDTLEMPGWRVSSWPVSLAPRMTL
mmetsp:Transcript_16867/g.42800  ORF Transcript_16867/g.42800 Transcript_16867/m.42800 type:complete len:232 (-) Transcript_16867:68-763(-)